MKIAFYNPSPKRTQEWIDCLRQQGLVFEACLWQEGDAGHSVSADYAIVWLPPESFFDSVRGLKAVFNMGAGVDAILKLSSLPPDLDVIRLDDKEIGQKMAEYVIHAVVEITRGMERYRQENNARNWLPQPYTYFQEWPIGIMGLGKIGGQLAGLLASLGYPVNGWSRSRKKFDQIRGFQGQSEFAAFLSASRIVINVLPLTDETRSILDAKAFAAMPAESFLINIGRGEHVDEAALLAAVQNGPLAGAVLDVFQQEPLPGDHPFWQEPKIRITPHISGATNIEQATRQMAAKIQAYEQGERVGGIVSRDTGY